MVKEGKILTMPTPLDETLELSASLTKGKRLGEDKEENKHFVTSATNAVELVDC